MWRQSERDKEKNGVKENNKNGQSEEIKAKRGKEKKRTKELFQSIEKQRIYTGRKNLRNFFNPSLRGSNEHFFRTLEFRFGKKRPDFNSARQIHDSRICNSLTKFEYGPAKRACTFNGA